MGFMDKAKKMAEQAQSKLDEVQKQFNEGQGSQQPPADQDPARPVTQYDAHGRPVPPADAGPPAPSAPPAPPARPHGDPLGASAPPPPPPPPAPEAATAPPAPPAPEAAAPPPAPPTPPAPPAPEGQPERSDEYAPPKLSSGDPLSG